MIYAYPCMLTPDEDGGLVATFPDVPEAITGGPNRSQALEMAEDALATALAGYVHEKWEIPAPSAAVDGQDRGCTDCRCGQACALLRDACSTHHQGGARRKTRD